MLLLVFLVISVLGCNENTSREITDRSGRTVTISGPVNRIISTAPSNTEIITDLGLAHKLVAIDRHSANIRAPAGYPDIPGGLPLLDFFYPDAEVIIGLKPDLVVASGHNPTGSGEDPFRLLSEAGIPVVYVPMSRSIDDIYEDIIFIAGIMQVQEKGEVLISSMKEQIQDIKESISTHSQLPAPPSVYFEISAAPEMMTFGRDSFIDSMISVIGAVNIFANDNWLVTPGAESIINRNPDVILTNVNYIDDPIEEIKNRPGFSHINAVINNRIYQIDTDSSVRSSARIITALRQMAEAVYPEENLGSEEPRRRISELYD
ncbi:MAG: ABC transporter substrate-binding protein [Treponema sp.]|nr:ABC transporter substrate-binding protein [Treponema sp.]